MENENYTGFFYLPYSLVEEIKIKFPEKFGRLDASNLIDIEPIFHELFFQAYKIFSPAEIVEALKEGTDCETRTQGLLEKAQRILEIENIFSHFAEITKSQMLADRIYSLSPPHIYHGKEIAKVQCLGRTNYLQVYKVRAITDDTDHEIIFDLGIGSTEICKIPNQNRPPKNKFHLIKK